MEEKVTKNIFLTGHVTEIAGPGYYLRDFLVSLPNCKNVVIFHPMPDSSLPESVVTGYNPDAKVIAKYPKTQGFLRQLISDTWVTVKHIWQFPGQIDIYVGLNNFDTLPALLFKGHKIKQVVYYGSDYADHRFANPIFDKIYRLVELVVLAGCNLSISNTYRAMTRRIELGLDVTKALMIPNGTNTDVIPKVVKKPEFMFIYQGYISKTHGLVETIESLKKLPKEKLAVAGVGPHEQEMKEFVHQLGMDKQVKFLGRLSHQDLMNFMKQKCQVGIASYTLNANWVKYGSPLKVKDYLACDMAVIMSDITEVAEEVKNYKMGIVYHDYAELHTAMRKLCADPKLLQKYIKNARKYIRDYNWKDMFAAKLQPHLAL